jgi:hypothetical protein
MRRLHAKARRRSDSLPLDYQSLPCWQRHDAITPRGVVWIRARALWEDSGRDICYSLDQSLSFEYVAKNADQDHQFPFDSRFRGRDGIEDPASGTFVRE